ncbi:MAG: putative toxin-antitoxin system toxin component, PIN family [bacterium]|nr:putative toxin-antitoxin system toxin component, PIN family [bacterium]
MGKIKVLLDTDVVISSLLSVKGASYEIIHKKPNIEKVISKTIEKEASIVSERLRLNKKLLAQTFRKTKIISLDIKRKSLINKYRRYVFDTEDSHVVASAEKSSAKFLLTYNTKHYDSEKIKNDFKIIVMKPGIFLQYLRSREGTEQLEDYYLALRAEEYEKEDKSKIGWAKHGTLSSTLRKCT